MKPKIFIAIPHSGTLCEGIVSATVHATRNLFGVAPAGFGCLTHNFNRLWCQALNMRLSEEFTHFAMIHSDVTPQPYWIDTLLEEMEVTGADVVSAVVAIKNDRGLTSTGIGKPDSWAVRRLTLTEVHALPYTFSIDDIQHESGEYLAINTGCWIADITRPWVDDFPGFSVQNMIGRDPHGAFHAVFFPEDWEFGRWLAEQGRRVFATTQVSTIHHGNRGYSSETAWGTMKTDEEYGEIMAHGRRVTSDV